METVQEPARKIPVARDAAVVAAGGGTPASPRPGWASPRARSLRQVVP